MVKGEEQSIICSYAFEGENPKSTAPSSIERERMAEIVGAFTLHGYDAYSVLTDPAAAEFTTREAYHHHAVEAAATRNVLFAVVTSERRDDWMALQAGGVLANRGKIILAYHEEAYGASPILQRMASLVISWNSMSELTKTIRTRVCDNIGNDSNIIWTSQRKTA